MDAETVKNLVTLAVFITAMAAKVAETMGFIDISNFVG